MLLDQPPEERLPQAGLVEFEDAETGARVTIDTSSERGRQFLTEGHTRRIAELQSMCTRCNADLVRIRNSPLMPLIELMRRRTARMR